MNYTPICEEKRSIFVDTDLGCDCDDAGALAVLLTLSKKLGFNVAGANICTSNPFSNGALDAILEYFHAAMAKTGAYGKKGFLGSYNKFTEHLSGMAKQKSEVVESVAYYNEVLSSCEDDSVVLVTIGQFNCVADFLKDNPKLFSEKVHAVVSMAGHFPNSGKEFNVECDALSSAYFIKNCPKPIYFAGYEPGEEIITEMPVDKTNPVAEAYRLFTDGDMRRQSWDLLAVLFAIEGTGRFFTLSDKGEVTVDAEGANYFEKKEGANRCYLKLTDKKEELISYLEDLMCGRA